VKAKLAATLRYKTMYRAWERFGLSLEDEDIDAMVCDIQEHRSIFVQKISNRIALHLVEVQGQLLPIVYDRYRGCPKTVLYDFVADRWLQRENVKEELLRRNGGV